MLTARIWELTWASEEEWRATASSVRFTVGNLMGEMVNVLPYHTQPAKVSVFLIAIFLFVTSIHVLMFIVPQVARVKSWPVDEVNGFIFFWYHAEQEEPSWRIPVIDELQPSEANSRNKTGSWLFRGRSDYKVNAHIQEIPENGADVAHLAHLHGPSLLLGSSLQTVSHKCQESDRFSVVENGSAPLLRHHWWVKWTSPELDDEESRHMAVAKLRQHFRLFGRFSFFHTVVEAQQIGPGLVHLFIETGVGKCVFIQTVTPVEPLVQRVVHRLYSEPRFITPAAKLLLWGESVMV